MIIQYTNQTPFAAILKDNNGIQHLCHPQASINIFLICGLVNNPLKLHFTKIKYCGVSNGWKALKYIAKYDTYTIN